MIFRLRPAMPPCLSEENYEEEWGKLPNWEKWGKMYEAQCNDPKKKNNLQWATYKGKRVNLHLMPLLRAMTQDHCAFCDGFPLDTTGKTIEHFRPKTKFPLLSHQWENLFYCCYNCQQKGAKFDEKLLKPDEVTYSFEKYFIYKTNRESIFLHPQPLSSPTDQERATITIEYYGLNKFGRPEDRWRVLSQYFDSGNPTIDNFSYRYLFL